MIILSLDISSTNIGISILQSHNKQLIYTTIIKPNKSLNIFDQFNQALFQLQGILDQWHPEVVVIEKYIPYMGKNSSAATIILLAQWNNMISFYLHNKNLSPKYLHVNTVRAQLKSPGQDKIKKEDVADILLSRFNINITANKSMDNTDAVALGIAYILKEGL